MARSSILKAGVMGWPVAHSLSPRLHGFWLRLYGISGSYEAMEVRPEDLAQALRALPDKGLRGVNLTIPHKETGCALIDDLDPVARRLGTVNLVTVGDGSRLQGRNTDVYGFAQNLLSSGFKPENGIALVLGAGGSAPGVIMALADMGAAEIRVANRTKARAENLARKFSAPQCKVVAVDWAAAPRATGDVELLVNATSLGMVGQPELDFPLETLPPWGTVADIVYAPLETGLLRRAKERRLRTIDGLGMLLHQARPSFAAFFDRDPEVTAELRRYVLTANA